MPEIKKKLDISKLSVDEIFDFHAQIHDLINKFGDSKFSLSRIEFKDDLISGVSKVLWSLEISKSNKKLFLSQDPIKSDKIIVIQNNLEKIESNKIFLLDNGFCKLKEDSIIFNGKNLKGEWNLAAADNYSGIQILCKGKNPTKFQLHHGFGEPFKKDEIRTIFMLCANKASISAIARLLDRPVGSIYSWQRRLLF